MSWETFWDLNPRLLRIFVDADIKRSRRLETEMYVLGTYVFNAVSMSLANGFRKKGEQPTPWMEEPIRIVPYTEKELEEQKQIEREKALAFFNAMIPDREGGEDNGRS